MPNVQHKELYRGKAKTVFQTENPNQFIMHFRDDTSAFNGVKLEKLSRKGMVNNYFNEFIMQYLASQGVKTHLIQRVNDTDSLVMRLEMLPIECVIRNRAAGNFCKRYGTKLGVELNPATFEFFLKSDELGDPPINESVIETLKLASKDQVAAMKKLSYQVNDLLLTLFAKANIDLVDFKLEFGIADGQLILGDEFTPDGCRLWDKDTQQPLDKDRFRQDLGDVVESYELVAKRLGIEVPG